jgi:hypothetical protein
MRRIAMLTALLVAVHLVGCQDTKEHKDPPFVPLPRDMDVNIFDTTKPADNKGAGNGAATTPATTPERVHGGIQ